MRSDYSSEGGGWVFVSTSAKYSIVSLHGPTRADTLCIPGQWTDIPIKTWLFPTGSLDEIITHGCFRYMQDVQIHARWGPN
jgi:hypothetical protein